MRPRIFLRDLFKLLMVLSLLRIHELRLLSSVDNAVLVFTSSLENFNTLGLMAFYSRLPSAADQI